MLTGLYLTSRHGRRHADQARAATGGETLAVQGMLEMLQSVLFAQCWVVVPGNRLAKYVQVFILCGQRLHSC